MPAASYRDRVSDATPGRAAGEFAAIERIAARFRGAPPGERWIGDDAAVVRIGDAVVAVAADAVAAGVHADLALTSLADLGWKALAANISDLAAMGLTASRAVVAVSGPPRTDLDQLYDGIEACAAEFACPVVGGDLTDAPALVVSVTALGNAAVSPPPVFRSGARVGDRVWVTGALGAAAAGLRSMRARRIEPVLAAAHARPVPRPAEGVAARQLGATAMIDVSDGFAADLGHVLDASGVGCELERLPVAAGATLEDAIAGGEDYELVWCAPPDADVAEAFARRGLRPPVVLGVCTGDPTRRLLEGRPLGAHGWRHEIG
jgi:thiamine-monophosphate kinase